MTQILSWKPQRENHQLILFNKMNLQFFLSTTTERMQDTP